MNKQALKDCLQTIAREKGIDLMSVGKNSSSSGSCGVYPGPHTIKNLSLRVVFS